MQATRRFVTYLELLQPRDGRDGRGDRRPGRGRDRGRRARREIETDATDDERRRPEDEAGGRIARGDRTGAGRNAGAVTIPDDPTVLSYLLAGIVQVEAPRRQALLEADDDRSRLGALLRLIDREIFLLERRLRLFAPDARAARPAPQLTRPPRPAPVEPSGPADADHRHLSDPERAVATATSACRPVVG